MIKLLRSNPKVEKIWSNKGLAITKMGQTGEKIDLQKIASDMPEEEKALEEISVFIQPEQAAAPEVTEPPSQPEIIKPVGTVFETSSIQPENVISVKVESQENPISEIEVNNREIPKHEIQEESKDYLIKGNSFFSKRKYDQAIDYFDISLRIDGQNSIAWNNKGLALARMEKIDESLACYEKALEITPEDHVFLINKGNILYKKRDYREAFKLLNLLLNWLLIAIMQ